MMFHANPPWLQNVTDELSTLSVDASRNHDSNELTLSGLAVCLATGKHSCACTEQVLAWACRQVSASFGRGNQVDGLPRRPT